MKGRERWYLPILDPSDRLQLVVQSCTRALAALIRRLELDVDTIAGVHGRLGTLADLHRAVAPASTHAASQDR